MYRGGTVHPAPTMDPAVDAQALEVGMKGIGCNKKAVVAILSKRSVFQRNLIAGAYISMFGEDLKVRLSKELSGDLKHCILMSFYDKAHVDAYAVYKAIKGVGTDDQILLDVICTATNDEMAELKQAYTDILNTEEQHPEKFSLEIDVKKDTSGDYQRLLIALIQGRRETTFDQNNILADCQALYEQGEANVNWPQVPPIFKKRKLGTNESFFIKTLVNRSWESINRINKKYEAVMGHDLLAAIAKETSGNFKIGLQIIVKTAMDRNKSLAEILYKSMKGVGTHDDNLIRMIIGHSEVDLALIQYVFDGNYPETLQDMVKGDTNGDYRDYLLAILGKD